MTFGKRLRAMRLQAGFTQQELSNQIGMALATIGKWELLNTVPRGKNLRKLAAVLNVTVDDLLGEDRRPVTRAELDAINVRFERFEKMLIAIVDQKQPPAAAQQQQTPTKKR